MKIVRAFKCGKCGHLTELPYKETKIKKKNHIPKKSTWKRWTFDEDKYITDFYRLAKTKTIAKALGRTIGSINTRAGKLGITKKKN